jgi:TonB family protein
MKKSSLQLLLSLGLFAAPFALSAKTDEQAYVESFKGRTDIPVPVAVVKPAVSALYVGQTVKLEFVVDAAGNVTNITPTSKAPDQLVERLTVALAQWKFAPARSAEGQPVSMKVVVPFRIAGDSALAMY